MKKINFNLDWSVTSSGTESVVDSYLQDKDEGKKKITLPHDAMILEKRKKDSKNSGQTGYYPGGIYYYSKTFNAPAEWKEKNVQIEFEGIQGISKINVNGTFIGTSYNGYANSFYDLNDVLKYGDENLIEISVNNKMEQNSRWYSGSGIYRDVNLYVGGQVHIPISGLKISPSSIEGNCGKVAINVAIENNNFNKHSIELLIDIKDAELNHVASEKFPITINGNTEDNINQILFFSAPQLWSTDNPYLYECHVSIIDNGIILDEVTSKFGIRNITLDPFNGLKINGIETKLRGTCLHHDNGIIGAVCLEDAERRQLEQIKEAGFNSIRSSHNQMSEISLSICDELGLLVIDELADAWNNGKNINDYSNYFHHFWTEDVKKMVDKDFNHPSVIMYSTGNEIKEAGTPAGAKLNREITNLFHKLDNSRFVTNGINGILATGDKFGEIIADVMTQMGINYETDETSSKKESTDEINDLNGMQAVLVGELANAISNHPVMTRTLSEFTDAMDIAGYNYLTGRHENEKQNFPHRVVLGTETFPGDIVNLWNIVENNSHVIGDFTWTGYDYLGEAGVGIFHYDGKVNFQPQYPDRTASIGDIDIIGNRKPISYYREVVYGIRKEPYIAVERLNRNGQSSSHTPWMWKDTISSWTWPGFEKEIATVHVFSNADQVELYLNGITIGKKDVGVDFDYIAEFKVPYEAGELKAVSYKNGIKTEEYSLQSAKNSSQLIVEIDKKELQANGQDLSYLMIHLADENGQINRFDQASIKLDITGSCSQEGFGSADPSCEGNYFDDNWDTYDGYLLAVIRSSTLKGESKITISAEGYKSIEANITVL